MALDFRSLIFEGMALIPTYSSWLLQCDMEPAYRYHRRVLKLLQWRCPPERWWLKTPAHMLLDRRARRRLSRRSVRDDPPRRRPRCCRRCARCTTPCRASSPSAPTPSPSDATTSMCGIPASSGSSSSATGATRDRFHDLSFDAVQRDPLAQVSRLYAALGDDLTAEARRRMQDWWAESSRQRSGPHHYEPATFGLDPAEIREQFAFYYDRFDVEVEATGDPS